MATEVTSVSVSRGTCVGKSKPCFYCCKSTQRVHKKKTNTVDWRTRILTTHTTEKFSENVSRPLKFETCGYDHTAQLSVMLILVAIVSAQQYYFSSLDRATVS